MENMKKKGLFAKYIIRKANGKPLDKGAKYFVMRYDHLGKDPIYTQACRECLMDFQKKILKHLPLLARDLLVDVTLEQMNTNLKDEE